jgi:hypothetical protein
VQCNALDLVYFMPVIKGATGTVIFLFAKKKITRKEIQILQQDCWRNLNFHKKKK